MTNNRPCRWFTQPASTIINPPQPAPATPWTPLPYLGWQQATRCASR